jgi:hypothetical protein
MYRKRKKETKKRVEFFTHTKKLNTKTQKTLLAATDLTRGRPVALVEPRGQRADLFELALGLCERPVGLRRVPARVCELPAELGNFPLGGVERPAHLGDRGAAVQHLALGDELALREELALGGVEHLREPVPVERQLADRAADAVHLLPGSVHLPRNLVALGHHAVQPPARQLELLERFVASGAELPDLAAQLRRLRARLACLGTVPVGVQARAVKVAPKLLKVRV